MVPIIKEEKRKRSLVEVKQDFIRYNEYEVSKEHSGIDA